MTPEDIAAMGKPSVQVTHFTLARVHENGTEERLWTTLDGAGAKTRHFPIAVCSHEWVQHTFGRGVYKTNWLKQTAAGFKPMGRGTEFAVADAPKPVAAKNKKTADAFDRRMRQLTALRQLNDSIIQQNEERAQRQHERELERERAATEQQREKDRAWMKEMLSLATLQAEAKASVKAASVATSAPEPMNLASMLPVAKTIAKELGVDLGDLVPVAKKLIQHVKNGEGFDPSVWDGIKEFLPGLKKVLEPVGLALAEKISPGVLEKYYEDEEEEPATN